MASGARRGASPRWDPGTVAAAGVLAVVLPIAVLVWGAVAAGGGDTAGGPVATLLRLLTGRRAWPGALATAALVAELVAVGGLAVLGRWAWRRFGPPRGGVDAAAAAMGRGGAIDPLRPDGAAARARRLIGDQATADPAMHGPLIGLSVVGNTPLRSSWEDVVDALRGPRSRRAGAQIWVFDPQDLAGEPCTWWWNPLGQIRSVTDAARLAGHFAAGSSKTACGETPTSTPPERSCWATCCWRPRPASPRSSRSTGG